MILLKEAQNRAGCLIKACKEKGFDLSIVLDRHPNGAILLRHTSNLTFDNFVFDATTWSRFEDEPWLIVKTLRNGKRPTQYDWPFNIISQFKTKEEAEKYAHKGKRVVSVSFWETHAVAETTGDHFNKYIRFPEAFRNMKQALKPQLSIPDHLALVRNMILSKTTNQGEHMFGHPDNPGFMLTLRKGFQLKFENGMTVSVQWGAGNYCQNQSCASGAFDKEYPFCVDAETAVWGINGNYIKRNPDDYDDVQPRQSPDQVAATIAWAASLPAERNMKTSNKDRLEAYHKLASKLYVATRISLRQDIAVEAVQEITSVYAMLQQEDCPNEGD